MNSDIPENLNDPEVSGLLKSIHDEQKRQTKYLQNMFQIQVILFALGLIAFLGGVAVGTGLIQIQF